MPQTINAILVNAISNEFFYLNSKIILKTLKKACETLNF